MCMDHRVRLQIYYIYITMHTLVPQMSPHIKVRPYTINCTAQQGASPYLHPPHNLQARNSQLHHLCRPHGPTGLTHLQDPSLTILSAIPKTLPASIKNLYKQTFSDTETLVSLTGSYSHCYPCRYPANAS